jgi:TonB-linked SusC/RagA family outer membrane protein
MRKKLLLMLSLLSLFAQIVVAQTDAIRGKVLDDKSEPLVGATIRVKGTSKGAVTDMNGNFKINVESGTTLTFSAIGMKTTEKPAQNGMSVKLASDTKNLRETVVTALAMKQDKRTIGYAQTSIKNETLNQGQNGNAITALSGKVAGLQIVNAAGTPGASPFIQLRGINSIELNTQPLFVVDGLPINTSASSIGDPADAQNNELTNVSGGFRGFDINPDDIEEMSVLKGPGATALYGSQGANGVILITTKKGAKGGKKGLSVEYNSSIVWDQVNKLPEHQNKFTQGVGGEYIAAPSTQRNSWGALADTMYWNGDKSYNWDKNGKLVGKSDPTAKTQFTPYDNNKQFFRTGQTYRNNFSISSGTENATLRLSYSNLKQNGIIPNTGINRNTLGLNADLKARENVVIGAGLNYVNTRGTYAQQGSNLSGVMLGLLRTPINFDNSNGNSDAKSEDAYLFPDGSQRTYRGFGIYDNPYYTVNENQYRDQTNRFFGNIYATWTPLSWVSITNRLGGDVSNTAGQQNYGTQSSDIPVVGRVTLRNENYKHFNNDFLVNLTPYLHKDLDFSVLLGQNIYSQSMVEDFTRGDNLIIDRWYNINNAQNLAINQTENSTFRRLSEFGNVKLGYKNFAFVEASTRIEHATSFWPNFKPNWYSSINGSFIFSDAFKLTNDKFTYGKLRLSYGTAGSNPPSQSTKTRWIQTKVTDGWTDGNGNPINGNTSIFESSIMFDDDLNPERTGTFEIGTELRFLKNRIILDYTFYNSNTKDIFVKAPIPASSGNSVYFTNAGTINNRGHEVQLMINPIKKRDFRWDVTVNYSRNRSNVVKLAEGINTVDLNGFTGTQVNLFEGKPYGILYGSGYLRDESGNLIIDDRPTVLNEDGVLETNLAYGSPQLDPQQKDLGSVMPDWLGGINNTFTYKRISLGILFETRQGGIMWNGTRGALTTFGVAKETEGRDSDQRVFEGVLGHTGSDGKIYHYDALGNEKLGTGGANTMTVNLNENYYSGIGGGFTINEPFIEDASWVRLRELSLSYSIPNTLLSKTKYIKGASFGFVGRNLLLWTKYKGVDPETSLVGGNKAQGLDYFNNPGTKSYGFNLKLNF